jgi:2-polyprenyl-3-methyl-5-hydroxy-6-metoxy-1,4-benzoquinol methylase
MSERAAHWENVYTTKAEKEVSWFQENPAMSLWLIEEAGASPTSRVIDIGGGASRLVDALFDKGFRSVAVLDISASALDTAKRRLGPRAAEVEWIIADVTRWTPSKSYDVWHDRAAFHFLTEAADRIAYVECLRSAVAPRGQVIIGTFALDGPEKCSGLPVQRHDSKSLADALGPDFELVGSHGNLHRTPWGSTQSFQFSHFRRA